VDEEDDPSPFDGLRSESRPPDETAALVEGEERAKAATQTIREPEQVFNKDGTLRKKIGRPRVEVNWEIVRALCTVQCSTDEIASYLHLSRWALERACKRDWRQTFGEYRAEQAKFGLANIRNKQYQLAVGGNVTMLIWLGKQYLGQQDRAEAPLIQEFKAEHARLKRQGQPEKTEPEAQESAEAPPADNKEPTIQ
jgi:AraC-like DNA-binding protein